MTARDVLDGIKGRLAERTALGEWEATRANDVVIYDPNGFGAYKIVAHAVTWNDATFIAAAPTDIPRLAGAIDAVLGLCEQTDTETNEAQQAWLVESIRAAIEDALREGE